MNTKANFEFNPMHFLASLGAGGIAVAPFGFFQYTLKHGKGLMTFNQLQSMNISGAENALHWLLMAVMVVFSIIHLGLTTKFLIDLFKWRGSNDYKKLLNDPLKNSGLIVPFISLAMTMNVFIGVIRFFVPAISQNFQALMLPALIIWGIMWALLLVAEIRLLHISFSNNFDVNKISFGWLLHPFALSMMSVTGLGIAAMAKNPDIAHTAAFMSMTSLSMGFFLFMVKLISVFTSHFNMPGKPERQFMPSFLIVVPISTLFAISLFRFGHYLEHQFGFHMPAFGPIVILLFFAFETWYLAFGLTLLKDYLKNDFFKKEYYVTLWALVCPFVGYSMLASFAYKLFVPFIGIKIAVFVALFASIGFFTYIFRRYLKYSGKASV